MAASIKDSATQNFQSCRACPVRTLPLMVAVVVRFAMMAVTALILTHMFPAFSGGFRNELSF